ncbi:acyl-CoA thioesterase domain-containing protein [Nocardioides sp. YIM 152315]|uniref:acyl-CoA thioesterase domain-containing protein n=1 Tax=Nocardioides sp. YIM 152315 TaxID=3031760 RepID=UPI0023DA31FB|nr:acyl-CoA thioesterase domain-containing protein [Nocardioides sp. YIM 152315]MDF1604293.1 thioesterase family protein [Nocardioides sp. YIM 152315]
MTDEIAFFTRTGDDLAPTPLACSMWSDDQLHGVALSGALARAAEQALAATGRDDLRPARWVVDLFRAARMQPCTLTTSVVREGSRICLVDVSMSQAGEPVARASATFLKPSGTAPGEVWQPPERPAPPPLDVAPETDEPRVPFLRSASGWSQDFTEHQNPDRKASWSSAMPVVSGEPLSPFQAVAAAADGASMVTNWGTRGVEYINTDIALTLAREPVGVEIGLLATDRVEHDGIASGTTAVFDRAGALGTVTVAALANARRRVDMGGVEYADDGRRRTASRV